MNLLAYRDAELFARLYRRFLPAFAEQRQALGRRVRLMEVCGTHTVAFAKTGVREALAEYVELVSGPGCPVCVTDPADIDRMIALAKRPETVITTFGDMMRVPGSVSNLQQERAKGCDVRVVYSPSQAVEIAKRLPQKQVVFLGVGFETTAPGIALSMQDAARAHLDNYLVYSALKLTPPAVEALIAEPGHQLDGFLLPGHVSVVVGRRGWAALERLNQPAVIGGFEPLDLLTSVYLLLHEMKKSKRSVINNYARTVREDGNRVAQELLAEVFTISAAPWRGFGELPQSGLAIRHAYRAFDARTRIPVGIPEPKTPKGCRCGEVVRGKESPHQCPLFAKACTPDWPLGPCMVSTEGTCATYYQFERGPQ